MKKVIKGLFFISLLVLLYYTYTNKKVIVNYVNENILYKQEIKYQEPNKYRRNYDFMFVKNTDNFFPNNYNELLNVFYTILNNGYNNFTFYCGKEYKDCLADVEKLSKDSNTLSSINNYVHPYNSYKSILINSSSLGEINVLVTKLYTDDDIVKIEKKIDEVIAQKITSGMSDSQKIRVIHDYIVNNTKYDNKSERVRYNTGIIEYTYSSNKALGPAMYNLAICGGYTDYMELFLERFNIKSYKISSNDHIWNYVYIDGKWRHLDLTWDDPLTDYGADILSYNYYLIDYNKLIKQSKSEHNYDTNIFIEK